uniref:Uncharacterized protein n=1 Tax=Lymantria dispar multicapsid nuclear polyhedrosis virus TaxID=10449 RepID=A0A1B1MQQ2_NPVLD|nr:hypothetical protein [Lymantria dispar multiple nucleopolyhedrovirus]
MAINLIRTHSIVVGGEPSITMLTTATLCTRFIIRQVATIAHYYLNEDLSMCMLAHLECTDRWADKLLAVNRKLQSLIDLLDSLDANSPIDTHSMVRRFIEDISDGTLMRYKCQVLVVGLHCGIEASKYENGPYDLNTIGELLDMKTMKHFTPPHLMAMIRSHLDQINIRNMTAGDIADFWTMVVQQGFYMHNKCQIDANCVLAEMVKQCNTRVTKTKKFIDFLFNDY